MRYIDNPDIYRKYHCAKWYKTRKLKLLQVNGLCERCLAEGIYNSAEIVHHKEYINDLNYDDDLVFYNLDNLEALCTEHHLREHFGKEADYYFDSEGNVIGK